MKQEQLENSIQDLIEGSISADDLSRLELELTSNPESMSCYLAYTSLDNLIHLEMEAAHHEPHNIIPIDTIIKRQKKRVFVRSALATVAAVALIGIVLQLVLVSNDAPMLSYKVSEGAQLELSHANSEDAPEGLAMEKGSRMKLTQGTVELTLASGVKSIIQAPADFTLSDDKKLHLDYGIAWFEVDEEGKGFIVETPTLTVTDYGTEFGIISNHDHPDEVHLLKGKVEVTSRHGLKKSEVLSGTTARMTGATGRLEEVELQPQAFLKKLPKGLPHLLHWSFDDGLQPEGYHPDTKAIQVNAVKSPKLVAGRIGRALLLDGSGKCLETDWAGIEGDNPRTVSFWFKAPKEGHHDNGAGIIAWGNRMRSTGKWKISLDNNILATSSRIRLTWGSIWVHTNTTLTPDKWTHIVVSSTGSLDAKGRPQADIYFDGELQQIKHSKNKELQSYKPHTSTTSDRSVPMVMGRDLYLNRSKQHFLMGEIDELYIYEKALNAEQVQELLIRSSE